MRVISLVCSNTEIVHALGMEGQLVGVDDHSDFPAEALGDLPRLGPELNIDVPAVAALDPDLVLASLSVPGHERVVEALEKAALPLLVLDPVSISDVFQDILTVAEALGIGERGTVVVDEMKAAFGSLEGVCPPSGTSGTGGVRTDPHSDPPPRILVQWWPKPVIAPGRLSWVQDLMEMAGGENPLGHEEVRSRPISDDEVAEMAPDAIAVSWCGVDPSKYRPEVVYDNPRWAGVPAIKNRQVHCVPEAFLGRPGPRLVAGGRALRRIVAAVRSGLPPG